jgi:two-component system nitrogen regulation response regulator GlnG
MKRVLVIDDSAVVRETLALVLGSEFFVLKRPAETGVDALVRADEKIDLLIYGVASPIAADVSSLLQLAAQAPCAVLFLVDSKTTARAMADRSDVACLAKPFNPYELLDRVKELLARREISPDRPSELGNSESREIRRFLEYPYLGRTAASLVHRFARSRLPVLILGEVGSGKERVARALFDLQPATTVPISLNAAEISADSLARKALALRSERDPGAASTALIIENLDRIEASAQLLLLDFLQREESRSGGWRLVTTCRGELLERVYRGDFLDGLYYRLATLTLKLPPLRERMEDIAALAAWFANHFGRALGLGEVTFSAAAVERLSNYLWFGNAGELETVVARTLAIQRKSRVEAPDLVFDFPSEGDSDARDSGDIPNAGPRVEREIISDVDPPRASNRPPPAPSRGENKSVDLSVMIHELAHELKNPMVTIKTFAQLLEDRYQDENFRARFQDVVGGDIERMDDLLEVMIEFADFSQPHMTNVPLEEKLRTVLGEASGECAKRQTSIKWKRNGFGRDIRTDEAQLRYVLKNTLLAVLSQAKIGSEIEVDLEKQGCVAISYLREGARLASISHYFNALASSSDDTVLPLRMLLAKQLVERNGGHMALEGENGERDILRLEFPLA